MLSVELLVSHYLLSGCFLAFVFFCFLGTRFTGVKEN